MSCCSWSSCHRSCSRYRRRDVTRPEAAFANPVSSPVCSALDAVAWIATGVAAALLNDRSVTGCSGRPTGGKPAALSGARWNGDWWRAGYAHWIRCYAALQYAALAPAGFRTGTRGAAWSRSFARAFAIHSPCCHQFALLSPIRFTASSVSGGMAVGETRSGRYRPDWYKLISLPEELTQCSNRFYAA